MLDDVAESNQSSGIPEFSIVIPVYNEAENIATLLRGIEKEVRGSYEIVVVYDFDEDTTLPVVHALDPPVASVRLVKNDIGRGVVNALRAGFQAADGWLGLVVTMGDLSDPPKRINALVEKLREGCDVVAGSRYMPGGKMVGGPWLKGNLSRAAGLVAYWLTGIGIHDVTTNFRAYSRRLVKTVDIESKGGFELGLELTTKCHLLGWPVGQVPSAWYDRTAGQSRFQLMKWLPGYLKWYCLLLLRDPLGFGTWWRRGRAQNHHFHGFFGVYERPGYGWIVGRQSVGVMIVAFDENDAVVMVRIRRPYHRENESSWELPGGGQDAGETLIEAGKRELKEETGYEAGDDVELSPIHFQPTPGMALYTHRMVTFRGCTLNSRPTSEDEGILEVRAFPLDELATMAKQGRITALPTLAALALLPGFMQDA